MQTSTETNRRAGASRGRPRKFGEPSKPITVRLPESILGLLKAVDLDRARAIAKLAQIHVRANGKGVVDPAPVRLVEVEPGHALIVVGPTTALRRIPRLRLVEIAPGSSILVLPSGMSLESLEIEIIDLLAHLGAEDETERTMLEELRKLIADLRRERRMTKSEIILVDLTSKRRAEQARKGSSV